VTTRRAAPCCGVGITLKGIPFGQPVVKEAVMKLCKADDIWHCNIDEARSIYLNKYIFGNLATELLGPIRGGKLVGRAYAKLGSEGQLEEFYSSGSNANLLELIQLLTEKYGKAACGEK
jgi:hypothetical protein